MPPMTIFLSYAHEDTDKVRKLYSDLRSAGFAPWMDEANLLPGQNWELEIQHAMRNSDFCILCLSKISVAKRGYIQKEMKRAVDILDEFPEETIYLIPARLDDCHIPDSVSRRQWVDLFQPEGMTKLIRALQFAAAKRGQQPKPSAEGQPILNQISISIDFQTKSKVERLQFAASRLLPFLQSIRDGQQQLSASTSGLTVLSRRWQGTITDVEMVRRLEALQKVIDLGIGVLQQTTLLTNFVIYADPQIGIGPGNVNEALAAYQAAKKQSQTAFDSAMQTEKFIQLQNWFPRDLSTPIMTALHLIRSQQSPLQAEFGKVGEI